MSFHFQNGGVYTRTKSRPPCINPIRTKFWSIGRFNCHTNRQHYQYRGGQDWSGKICGFFFLAFLGTVLISQSSSDFQKGGLIPYLKVYQAESPQARLAHTFVITSTASHEVRMSQKYEVWLFPRFHFPIYYTIRVYHKTLHLSPARTC